MAKIDVHKLPRDPTTCQPVYPHDWIKVNNIFEVAKAAKPGKVWTAWTDKTPTNEWVNGPSGAGVDDLFGPEYSSFDFRNITLISQFDALRMKVVVDWINGKKRDGTDMKKAPIIFGANINALNFAEKFKVTDSTHGAPFLPGPGRLWSPQLLKVFKFLDAQFGLIKQALISNNLISKTVVIITAKHGQSPVDVNSLWRIGANSPGSLLSADPILGSSVATFTEDTSSLIWLKDKSKISKAVDLIESQRSLNGAFRVYSGSQIQEIAAIDMPWSSDRVPDVS